MMDSRDIIRDWYKPIVSSQSSVFDDAFNEAKTKIAPSLISNRATSNLMSSKQGVEELQKVVVESMNQYESKHRQSKTAKWLRSFSQRVLVYADVLDVLVQHHPEYVSLVWGTMKFLFMGVVNHETTICKLAKTLSKAADALPRVKLATILYPTDRMRSAVTELHTYILRFLVRAHAWYQEGSWKHLLHSITQPAELRYGDLIEAIAEKSRVIDQLALSCQQAEFRDVHEKVNAVNDKMDKMLGVMNIKFEEVAKTLKAQPPALTSALTSALVPINSKLSDLQLADIMKPISDTNMVDPVKAFHYMLAARQRAYRSMTSRNITLSRRFWNSPRLRTWNTSQASDIIIMKGSFQSRQAVRNFCVDIIEHLSDLRIPIIHALRLPQETALLSQVSCIDILKYIIRQVLQLQINLQIEKSVLVGYAAFYGNRTEAEWFQVLKLVLSQINKPLYIVLDLKLVYRNLVPLDTFSWLSAFQDFFQRLSAHNPSACMPKKKIIPKRSNYKLENKVKLVKKTRIFPCKKNALFSKHPLN